MFIERKLESLGGMLMPVFLQSPVGKLRIYSKSFQYLEDLYKKTRILDNMRIRVLSRGD
jgi:hypothetical protein